MADQVVDVVVIGGGAAGALTACGLVRAGFPGNVCVVSRSPQVGRGVAYGTSDLRHLLNVRAGNMSAFPDEPGDFVQWLAQHGAPKEDSALTFQPRRIFGDYLAERLAESRLQSRGRLTVVEDSAVLLSGQDGKLRVSLASEGTIECGRVVLALGNLPVEPPKQCASLYGNLRFVNEPWSSSAIQHISQEDDVLILGSGLTMVDTVLSLLGNGHVGNIFVRSRNGLLPSPHKLVSAKPEVVPSTIEELVKCAKAAGSEWRGVIDSVRAMTPAFWGGLPWEERRRILHRLMPFWNVARHRMPESAAEIIDAAIHDGRLDVGKGRIVSASADSNGITAVFTTGEVTAGWLINATGPSSDWRRAKVPLLESAVQSGLIEYDPLGQGILVDSEGAANPNGTVFALGALCRGCRLETTAIPEIRVQAKRIGEVLSAQQLPDGV